MGILFIHSIGAQRRGQSLAEFGRPIYFWLQDRFRGIDRRWREAIRAHSDEALLEKWRGKVEDWANEGFKEEDTAQHNWPDLPCEKLEQLAKSVRCETVVSRAVLTDAVINDPEDPTAPAHAELRLQWQRNVRGPVETEDWLLAESWWADTCAAKFFRVGTLGLSDYPLDGGEPFWSARATDRSGPPCEVEKRESIYTRDSLANMARTIVHHSTLALTQPLALSATSYRARRVVRGVAYTNSKRQGGVTKTSTLDRFDARR